MVANIDTGVNSITEVKEVKKNDKDIIDEYNNNPKLAEEEATRIVEGLPDTLNQLTPEQQKQFVKLMEPRILNLDLEKLAGVIPNRIPKDWKDEFTDYTSVRSNISKLPPDKQEAIKEAEKDAIIKITTESSELGLPIDK